MKDLAMKTSKTIQKIKIGRNDMCPCQSGRKFKHCCGQSQKANSFEQRIIIDWMAGFLEDNVLPHLETMPRDFQLEYVKIYAAWARDPIHMQQVYDTDKCWRMVEIAEEHLKIIASKYYRRFFIYALRTIPLSVMVYVTMATDGQKLVQLLRSATIAAWLYTRPTQPGQSVNIGDGNQLQIMREELNYAEVHLGSDIARFMGAMSARHVSEISYRLAGKGRVLKQPEPVPQEAWKLYENYSPNKIIITPGPTFEPDEMLQRSMKLYDTRRMQQFNPDASGLLQPQSPASIGGQGWWYIGVPGNPLDPLPIEVFYPTLNRTITTKSYFVFPIDPAPYLEQLKYFATEFPKQMGFDYDCFAILCHALYALVAAETAYWQLDHNPTSSQIFSFQSNLTTNYRQISAASAHLYSLFARGTIRGPREGFSRYLAQALEKENISNAEVIADRFIECFSQYDSLDQSLSPTLFFSVDDNLLMLDILQMNEFFELCLRVVTSGSDQIGNRRAKLFEEAARTRIKSGLNLDPADIPFKPNRDLVEAGKNYGDVDFAFIWKDVLINLDMKSWQRSKNYYRGDFKAIDNRQKELVEQLAKKVEPRGKKLLEVLNRDQRLGLTNVLNLLCVANVEYVSPKYPELWYSEIPRVLTPDEIIAFVKNENQMQIVIQSAIV